MTDTNKMLDPVREQFEAWYGDECGLGAAEVRLWRKGERYSNQYERCGIAWVAWQASRQAVVVELPELSGITNAEDVEGSVIVPRIDQAYDQAIHECHEAIEAQGLRVGVRK